MLRATTVLSLMAVAQTSTNPSIHAENDNIAVRVAVGNNATLQYYDRSGSLSDPVSIVGEDHLYAELDSMSGQLMQTNDAVANISNHIGVVESTTNAAIESALSTVQDQLSTLGVAVDLIRQQLNATLPSCPPYPNVSNGVVLGHGNSLGSTRVIQCDDLALLQGDRVVVCHEDGTWSDNLQTRCVPGTAAPTMAPTVYEPTEVVTCCIAVDDDTNRVFVDGQPISMNGGGSTNGPGSVRFNSTAQVLGIYGRESRCGCGCGFISMFCTTPSGRGRWNMATPDRLLLASQPSLANKWKAFAWRNNDYNGFAGTGAWSSPNYNISGTFQTPLFNLGRADGTNYESQVPLHRFSEAATYRQCPRVEERAGYPGLTHGIGTLCDSVRTRPMDQGQVKWLFRYDKRD